MTVRACVCAVLLLHPAQRAISAQDSTRTPTLPDVVVTAELIPVTLARSAAAVTVLRGEDLRALPGKNLADALRQVPGLLFVDFAGKDIDPQAIVRGFYGGGEADYVLVLVDGERINAPGSGRVNWDAIPLHAVESVEILRGAASSLYGDAAIGAVISIRTSRAPGDASWAISGGEHGLARLSGRLVSGGESRSMSGFADISRQEGFRRHSRRDAASLGAAAGTTSARRSVWLSILGHRRALEDPGPLVEAELSAPETSSPFFRFDKTDERFLRVSARTSAAAGRSASVGTQLSLDMTDKDVTRTVPLSTDFADTKRRLLNESRLSGAVTLEAERSLLGRAGRMIAGVELSRGTASSTYSDHTSGDAATYTVASGGPGDAGSDAGARRVTTAAFAQYELEASSRLRVVLGARGDRADDDFNDEMPASGAGDANHSAFSPRAAVNFNYLRSAAHRGHAYLSGGRSFKAPTLDQLFDRRTVPVPFPPYAITFSNQALRPQYAKSLEAGMRHWILPATGTAVEISAAAYSVRMVDEIDFDVQELRYMNIGRSRHDGVEAGVEASRAGWGSLFVNYALQDATSRFGENAGKQLKAIPGNSVRAGITIPVRAAALSIVATQIGRAYLDDANTRRIPGYTTVDAKLTYTVRGLSMWVAGFNVLDRRYSTTGFADPAGSDVSFFYPAAGRFVQAGIATGR